MMGSVTKNRWMIAAAVSLAVTVVVVTALFLLHPWSDGRSTALVESSQPPPVCLTANQARAEAKRLLIEAGINPAPQYTGIRGAGKVTCIDRWALVEELAVYPWEDAVRSDYFHLSGPTLVEWKDSRWVGVSAKMMEFDCGADGCKGEWPTNKPGCAKAPQAFKAKLGC
jgi:hypothetical protein